MATIKGVSSGASIGTACDYVADPKKCVDKETGKFYISGIDCSPRTAIDEMKATKELWGKTGGREYKHYSINFAPGENVTHAQAHEMARQLAAERFKGYEVLIATHTDKDHVHSHLIVNSVSHEDGRKYREAKAMYQELKDRHDELCRERGLTVTEKGKGFDGKPPEKVSTYGKPHIHEVINKGMDSPGTSWKVDAATAAIAAMDAATNRAEFIRLMEEQGYSVRWADTRRQITFTNAEGQSVRNENIQKTFGVPFGKEDIEREFARNIEKQGRAAAQPGPADIEPVDYSGAIGAAAAERARERAEIEAADERVKQREAQRVATEREGAKQAELPKSSPTRRSTSRER